MATRYHQGGGHKRGHHGDHHEHGVEDGYFAGEGSRRHEEMELSSMIHEDEHAIANLPQNVIVQAYPKKATYLPEDLDDTLRGVDEQMEHDDSKRRAHFAPKKV